MPLFDGDALMSYARTSLPGVQAKGDGHSNIEWLIDVFTSGDRRQGGGGLPASHATL